EAKCFEFQWFSDRYLLQDIHIGVFNANCEEHVGLRGLALANALRRASPSVGWCSIGYEEHPGSIIGDTILFIDLLPLAKIVKTLLNGRAHWCIAGGCDAGRLKYIRRLKF